MAARVRGAPSSGGARVDDGGARVGPGATAPPWAATSFLRNVRTRLEQGGSLAGALADASLALPSGVRREGARASRRLRGHYPEDEWGLDEEFTEMAMPFLEFLFRRWWRVDVEGVARVPSHGPALLVANHAGIVPWDATMIGMAIIKRHPLPRMPRFLVLDWAWQLPYVSVALRKLGSVPASPHNALQLLEQGELVGVFPEGVKGTGKAFKDRYRLQRFGRGGFVELALMTGAPIVPVAVVGSEEIYPKLADAPLLARALGVPFFPLTPTFPLLGPLAAVPLPSKWRIEFCEPIDVVSYGAGASRDRSLVFELSEHVRQTIQHRLYANLVARGRALPL